MSQEVEEFNISFLLNSIELETNTLRDAFLEAIDTSSPDFLNYKSSIDGMTSRFHSIQESIDSWKTEFEALQKSEYALPASDTLSLLNRIERLKTLGKLLHTCIQMSESLEKFHTCLSCYQPDIASDCLKTTATLMNSAQDYLKKEMEYMKTSAPQSLSTGSDDYVYFVHYFNLQLLGGQNQLNQFVENCFNDFIRFFSPNIEVSLAFTDHDSNGSFLTLEQLWYAAKGTPLIKERLAQLITSLIENTIDPVMALISDLLPGRKLTCKKIFTGASSNSEGKTPRAEETDLQSLPELCSLSSPTRISPSTAIWTCVECQSSEPQDSLEDAATRRLRLFLSVLHNLFEFISRYFFPGHSDLLESMGQMLWPDLCHFLMDLVTESQVSNDILIHLRDFETKLQGLHVLPFTTNTLATFTSQYDLISLQTQRRQLLIDIRNLCSSSDPTLFIVGEKGSHDVLQKSVDLLLNTLKNDSSVSPRLLDSLDKSPLILPKCNVSKAVFETVSKINQLLKNVLNCIRDKDLDDSHLIPTLEMVRHAASFFVFLRVSLHHKRLITDAQYAAIFYNDLLFLSQSLLLLLPTVEEHIPRSIQAKQCQISLLDVFVTIRPVQEEIFNAMLMYRRKLLINTSGNLPSLTHLSVDHEYMAAEAMVAEIVQSLKSLVELWTNLLPSELLGCSFATLLDTFLNLFLQQICDQVKEKTQLPLPDCNALAFLLSSTHDQLAPVVHSLVAVEQNSRSWSTFNLFKQLIETDTSQLLCRKAEIRETFSLDAIKTILAVNVRLTNPHVNLIDRIMSSDE